MAFVKRKRLNAATNSCSECDTNGTCDSEAEFDSESIEYDIPQLSNRLHNLPKIDLVKHFGDYPNLMEQVKQIDSKSHIVTKSTGETVNTATYVIDGVNVNNYSDYFKLCEPSDYLGISQHVVNHVLGAKKLKSWGFTKPSVLIVCPFRNDAYKFVTSMLHSLKCTGTKCKLEKQERFLEEYFAENEHLHKSESFKQMFEGNVDDNFKFGLKISKKQITPFVGFYGSDVLIASPLALHKIIGETGSLDGERDFLSSIQVSVFFHAHVFTMQNMLHLDNIFENLNKIPKVDRGADISKISAWYLDDLMRYKRQTIVTSDFWTPEIVSWQKYCYNVNGRVKESRFVEGCIQDIQKRTPMVFQRIPECKPIQVADVRFHYFTQKVLPKTLQNNGHTVILVPSYFDFLRLQKYCKNNDYNHNSISEYTRRSKVDRSRHHFGRGEVKILLVSERLYFFKRTVIKGAKHLYFYAPPTFPFFAEMLNWLGNENDDSCLMLFSKFDQMSLERVVGTDRVQRMIKGQKETFMIVS